MRDDLAGTGWTMLASVSFGAVVILGKTLADDAVPIIPILAVRFGIACLVLAIIVAATGRPMRPARGEAVPLVILGVAGYAVEAGFFFLAIERGTATAVTLLFFVYPVVVMAITAVLGRAMPRALVVGSLGAAVAGVVLVVGSSGEVDVSASGIAFALGSAATFAVYMIGAERTLKATGSLVGAMWVSGAASAALALVALASGTRFPQGGEWVRVAGMGTGTAVAFVSLFAGLRLLGAMRASIVAATEPLSTAILAAVFLAEPLRFGTIAGGALILAGAITAGVARGGGPREPETAVP